MAEIAVNLKGQDNLTNTVKNATKAVDELKYHSTELGKSYKEFEKITNSGKSLKAQLNQLKALMADMNMKGLSGSDEFNQIAQYAGQVKDAISDASQAVDKFSSDTLNLDASIQALQGVAAAGSIATGAMALFGVENEHVTQTIMKVQSALAILNGVQAIANVLNKDSALMLKLKSLGFIGNTTATAANTVAESANTTATTANTAGEVANTTAKTANTAATNAATTAQLAHNAAVLANPYVLAAAAVVALTAGIVALVSANNDATDSQLAVNMAIDAFNDEVEKQMGKVSEQITTFNRLKKTYDESGGKVDILTKKIINNKEAQRILGVTLKTVDDVHKLFGRNSQNYVNAAIARANAMAAEAAEAALLGKALSALSKVYAKLMKGEEVDYADFTKALEAVGINNTKAWNIMQQAGGQYEQDIIFGNLKVDPDKVADFMKEVNKLVTEEFYRNGPGKTLGELFEQSMADFETETIDFNQLYTDNNNAEQKAKKITKQAKDTKKETKQTHEEIKKILTTLEGCDAIIQDAEKQMKKLDRTSKTYEQDVQRLKKVIQGAKAAKLLLIDYSTISGLSQAKSIIQDIMKDLQPSTDEFKEWDKQLKKINEQAYEMAKKLSVNGDLQSLKGVQSALNTIIDSLPEGSDELEKWVKLWNDVNDKITKTNQRIDDLKKGIEEGSIAKLQQQIKEIDQTLQNKNLTTEVRIGLNYNKRELQMQLDELQRGELSIGLIPDMEYTEQGSFEDLEKSAENARTVIAKLQSQYEKGIIDKGILKKEIWYINRDLAELGLKPIQIYIKTNMEEVVDDIKNGFSELDSLISATDSVVALTQAIEENADAWDVFKAAVSAVEGVLNGIQTIMGIVNTIQEISTINHLRKVAALNTEIGADQAAVIATEEKAAADAAAVAPTTASTVALKAQEAAYLDMAAAAIFAAHASIPFAGIGIASGYVSAMMAVMAAQHAASAALAAFKEGGIVQGSYSEHPILAHKGEMVLNEHQQQHLFDLLDSGGAFGGLGDVRFVLKGSDLYGSFHNYTRIKSKVGKTVL